MNTRWTTLLTLTIAFALVACGGNEDAPETTPETDPAPATGPSEPTPEAGTPEKTEETALAAYERIKSSVAGSDYSSFYDYLSSDTRGWVDTKIGQARDLLKTAESGVPGAADMAKSQLGSKYGFTYDDLKSKPTRDLGGKLIAKVFGEKVPGVLAGEVQGEPKGDENAVTLTVKKPNGKMKDVDMVKEDGVWKLKYEF